MPRLLALLPLLALLCAPALAQRGEVFFDQRFDFRPGDLLELSTSSPDVTIETHAGDGARVTVHGTGSRARELYDWMRFSAERQRGKLVVGTNPRGNFSSFGRAPSLTIVVSIPERASANVTLSSGDLTVGRLRGDLTVRTSSGDVELADVVGDVVQVQTSSGDVSGGHVTGRQTASLRASSGDISLREIRGGTVSTTTSSGDFSARAIEARHFEGNASSGTIRVEALRGEAAVHTSSGSVRFGDAAGPVSVRTSSGRVQVALARAVPVEITTSSGSIELTAPAGLDADLALTSRTIRLDRGFAFQGDSDRRGMRGRLGRGGTPIRVTTSSGSVTLSAR